MSCSITSSTARKSSTWQCLSVARPNYLTCLKASTISGCICLTTRVSTKASFTEKRPDRREMTYSMPTLDQLCIKPRVSFLFYSFCQLVAISILTSRFLFFVSRLNLNFWIRNLSSWVRGEKSGS